MATAVLIKMSSRQRSAALARPMYLTADSQRISARSSPSFILIQGQLTEPDILQLETAVTDGLLLGRRTVYKDRIAQTPILGVA
ncbi:hypothetical protein J6590_026758 [Homalodisca vitripennis]|nr:hypothetical protein J6590_026758 [Homalodisca vitripennis]